MMICSAIIRASCLSHENPRFFYFENIYNKAILTYRRYSYHYHYPCRIITTYFFLLSFFVLVFLFHQMGIRTKTYFCVSIFYTQPHYHNKTFPPVPRGRPLFSALAFTTLGGFTFFGLAVANCDKFALAAGMPGARPNQHKTIQIHLNAHR